MTKFTPFKTLLVLATTLATFTSVQAQVNFLPPCGLSCSQQQAEANGCGANDLACACPKEPFLDAAIDCIYENCPFEDRYPSHYRLSDYCQDPSSPPPAWDNGQPPPAESEPSPPPAGPAPSSSTQPAPPANPSPSASNPSAPAAPNPSTLATPTNPSSGGNGNSPSQSRPGVGGVSAAPSGLSRRVPSAASTVVVVETVAVDENGLIGDGSGANAMRVNLPGCITAVVVGFLGMGIGAGLIA